MVDDLLAQSAAPTGPIRFSVQYTLRELVEGQQTYGLLENAAKLSDRSILLVGGWQDQSVTIEDSLLPLCRALRRSGGDDVRFVTYHADHSFASVRDELHEEIRRWILR